MDVGQALKQVPSVFFKPVMAKTACTEDELRLYNCGNPFFISINDLKVPLFIGFQMKHKIFVN